MHQPAEETTARRSHRARRVDVVEDRLRLDRPSAHEADAMQRHVDRRRAAGRALAQAVAAPRLLRRWLQPEVRPKSAVSFISFGAQ